MIQSLSERVSFNGIEYGTIFFDYFWGIFYNQSNNSYNFVSMVTPLNTHLNHNFYKTGITTVYYMGKIKDIVVTEDKTYIAYHNKTFVDREARNNSYRVQGKILYHSEPNWDAVQKMELV